MFQLYGIMTGGPETPVGSPVETLQIAQRRAGFLIGTGWNVLLVKERQDGKMVEVWRNDHADSAPSGRPIETLET